ncbi:MAG TPA: hypothetical protein PK771_10720, partial [Spirochaetota bacterium]|nr:hypothetical protein [Spirochaetota bacterium]
KVTNSGTPGDLYKFSFSNCGVKDLAGNELTTDEWIDSQDFQIKKPTNDAFINITSPYDYQVFYEDMANVDIVCTNNTDYYVLLSNETAKSVLEKIAVGATGLLTAKKVSLNYGYNVLKATLYNVKNEALAEDIVKVYRSANDLFVKIDSPSDHALVNSDMIRVEILSSFSNLIVNGEKSTPTGVKRREKDVYYTNLFLKEGFNTIKAVAKSPENAIYSDSIVVYYQRNDGVFKILSPVNGTKYKSGDNVNFTIKGEIGSLYNKDMELNTVDIDATYYPSNSYYSSKRLLNNVRAVVTETDINDGTATSSYIFKVLTPVSLKDIDTGYIHIKAYKNKRNGVIEDEKNCIIYVDNGILKIELIQPNIYGKDILDSDFKLKEFNDNQDVTMDGIDLNGGSFVISSSDLNIVEDFNGNFDKIIKTKKGDLYALQNKDNRMSIYKKSFNNKIDWKNIISRSDLYGYDICETDFGIMVGVSHYYSNGESGLYIIENNSLKNISIGESIPDVQFIVNNNDNIYIYGNEYLTIYSFQLNSLESSGNGYRASVVDSIPFNNNLSIKKFILSENAKNAMILTVTGRLYFYTNYDGNRYVRNEIKDLNNINCKNVIYGKYNEGDFNSYLILTDDVTKSYIVMENKNSGNINLLGLNLKEKLSLEDSESIYSCSFDNYYYFIVKKNDNKFGVVCGKIFFDQFYEEKDDIYSEIIIKPLSYSDLLVTEDGEIYIGQGVDNYNKIYKFTKNYLPTGRINFKYKNDDVEELVGFSFNIKSKWIDPSSDSFIKFGFEVPDSSGKKYQVLPLAMKDFVRLKGDFYNLKKEYNNDTSSDYIFIEFKNLKECSTILFDLSMDSNKGATPSISNL